jgi:phage shock protein A
MAPTTQAEQAFVQLKKKIEMLELKWEELKKSVL